MSTLGSHIKACRERLQAQYGDYSIRSVAKRIGIHHSYLSKLERGEHAPLKESTLRALAKDLDLDFNIACSLGGVIAQPVLQLIRNNPERFSTFIHGIEQEDSKTQGRVISLTAQEQRNHDLEELVRRLRSQIHIIRTTEPIKASSEIDWNHLFNCSEGFYVGLLDAELNLLWNNDAIKSIIDVVRDNSSETPVVGRYHEIFKSLSQPCPGCSALKCLSTGEIQMKNCLSCLPGVGEMWVTNIPMPQEQGSVRKVLRIGFRSAESEEGYSCLARAQQLMHHTAVQTVRGGMVSVHPTKRPDGYYSVNAGEQLTKLNDVFAQILGYGAQDELVGKPTEEVWVNPGLRDEMLAELNVHDNLVNRLIILKTNRGEHHYVSLSTRVVYGEDGTVQGREGVIKDITDQKQLEEYLLFRTMHDPLTGLPNRTLTLERIFLAEERAAYKPGGNFAVVFIDIHRFKIINDSLGHQAGDALLCMVAKRLLSCVRPMDTVSRYSGDVFVLVLDDLSMRNTVQLVRKLRENLEEPMTIGSHAVSLHACYGIAYPSPLRRRSPEVLLRNADIAMHKAKVIGRDKIVVYNAVMHVAASENLSLQSDMRRGLAAGEFFMVYQPIFKIGTNCLSGFEALIRWNHPQRGLVSPKDFIPQAEDSGFIFELGQFSLERAGQDMAKCLLLLNPQGNLTVSVNLSPRQFSGQGLIKRISQMLTSTSLPPSRLLLEITESSLLERPKAARHTLDMLKKMGIGIALDDFGIGYSSLSILQTLPLDRLKVDMSFVVGMANSQQGSDIVKAIIHLGHSMSLKLVAEGIQTEQQLLALQSMGCDFGQGFLYSSPLLLADVPTAILEKS